MKSTPGVGIAEVWESGLDRCSRTREQERALSFALFSPHGLTEAGSWPPLGRTHGGCTLASILPALLMTILIFMDQQITAVIVSRKENKLR